MSDRREWARKTLTKWAAEIGAWPERKNDRVFQKALIDIAADEAVVEIVAHFGGKITLMPYFVAHARRDPIEEAIGRMMSMTASVMADQYCRPVFAKAIVEKREELEKKRAYALSLTPYDNYNECLRGDYVAQIDALLAVQAPLSDPIVERRSPTRKELDGGVKDYAHTRGVCARVQELGRHIFGKAGDRVTDAFVTAVTGVLFSPDDRKVHSPDRRVRRKR
jgi:hypothetical protein